MFPTLQRRLQLPTWRLMRPRLSVTEGPRATATADRLAGLPRVLKGGAGKPRYPITLHLARFQSQQMIVELDAYPDVWRLSVQRTPAEVNAIEAHLRQRNVVDLELNKAATTEQMVSRIATRISDFRGFPPGWFA